MPDLVEHMYCSQQIDIPSTLPFIMKQYAKAAIRTQPYDLLRWTACYFKALAEETTPPIKPRYEHVPIDSPSGLTPGYLRVLLRQLGHRETVNTNKLFDKWYGVCLNEGGLNQILKIGNFDIEVQWLHFVAIAAGHLTRSLGETMVLLCELLTREPDGGSAMIPCETFVDLYTYLARLNCGPCEYVEPTPTTSVAEIDLQGSAHTPNTPSSSTVGFAATKSSIESVGEEPFLEPLVYFKPDHTNIEQTRAPSEDVKKQDKLDAIEQPIVRKEHLFNPEIRMTSPADRETQTDDPYGEKLSIHIPGIGPVIPEEQIQAVVKYMEWWAERQQGMSMPRHIRHFLCPPLDLLPIPEPCILKYHYPNTNIYP